MKKAQSGYQKLYKYSNWSDTFYLTPQDFKILRDDYHGGISSETEKQLRAFPKIDPKQYYDVILPTGVEHLGCKVEVVTHTSRGSEDSSKSETFVFADGLEIRMRDGFLLRPNPAATQKETERQRKASDEYRRKELLREREDLDKELKSL